MLPLRSLASSLLALPLLVACSSSSSPATTPADDATPSDSYVPSDTPPPSDSTPASDTGDAAPTPDARIDALADAPPSDSGDAATDAGPSVGVVLFPSLVQSDRQACALTADGSLYCWGDAVPMVAAKVGTTKYKRITGFQAGGVCTISMSDDASCNGVAIGGAGRKFVSYTGTHAYNTGCGVMTDGTVICGGFDGSGQAGQPSGSAEFLPATDAPKSLVTAGGEEMFCSLSTDGKPWCWGKGYTYKAQKLDGTGVLTSMVMGGYGGCGLDATGIPYCWTSYPSVTGYSQFGTQKFVALGAGYSHTCAIDLDGKAWCWGDNNNDACGLPFKGIIGTPGKVSDTLKFASVAGGINWTCALTTAGAAYCWGKQTGGTPTAVGGGITFATP